MSLIPTVYESTDPGAPQLSGTVGSLLSVLRAVLVSGYGTAPNAKPGLGWTEEFTGTNISVFRNSAVTGSGARLRVDDSGSGSAGAREALIRSYGTMDSVSTGLDPAPTPAQLPAGLVWVKSLALSSATRSWRAIGTERGLYLLINPSGGSNEFVAFAAFDLQSQVPADNFCFMVCGSEAQSQAESPKGAFYPGGDLSANVDSSSGCFVTRSFSGAAGAVRVGFVGPSVRSYQIFGSAGITYPDPVSGGLLVEPVAISEGHELLRGYAPGVYAPLHARPLAEGEYGGLLPGVDTALPWLVTARIGSASATYLGQLIFDISSEWY